MALVLVEQISSQDNSNNDNQDVVFSATPADDELIVLAATIKMGSGGDWSFGAGFTELTMTQGLQFAYKIASSESSATYNISNTVSEEMVVSGWRITGADTTSPHVAGGAGTEGSNTVITTGSADSGSEADFIAIGMAQINKSSNWTTPATAFGGTATGGSDTDGNEHGGSGSGTDIAMTSGHRFFTGAGTVTYTSRTATASADDMRARVELFKADGGGGGGGIAIPIVYHHRQRNF